LTKLDRSNEISIRCSLTAFDKRGRLALMPTTSIQLPPAVLAAASAQAIELTKARLGVAELPADLQKTIQTKVAEAASTRASRDLDTITASALSQATATGVKVQLKTSLATGVDRIKAVIDDDKYGELVNQSA